MAYVFAGKSYVLNLTKYGFGIPSYWSVWPKIGLIFRSYFSILFFDLIFRSYFSILFFDLIFRSYFSILFFDLIFWSYFSILFFDLIFLSYFLILFFDLIFYLIFLSYFSKNCRIKKLFYLHERVLSRPNMEVFLPIHSETKFYLGIDKMDPLETLSVTEMSVCKLI
jgi:hypothetical protein